MQSPFYHYNSSFDPIALMRQYEAKEREASPDLLTNFLGIKIDPKMFGDILPNSAGVVEPVPIPANWHADIAEWGAALRAVELAKNSFRMVELGCGWGCWMNNTGAAARSRGLKLELIGVEGDEGHVESAYKTLAMNGFQESEYRVLHAIAAPERGTALFPVVANPGGCWGSAPVFNATRQQIDEAIRTGGYSILEAYPLHNIAEGKPVDLLHIDIQGGEVDYVVSNFNDISSLVRRVLIGTHSRQIEGELMAHFLGAGWALEMERPAIFDLLNGRPAIRVDGVQLYANPRFGA